LFASLLTYTPEAERVVATAARLCYAEVDCQALAARSNPEDDRLTGAAG